MPVLKLKRKFLGWFFISFFVLTSPIVNGQEMTGFVFSNYNALGGSLTNPSLLTNSKNYLEINLVTFDFFAWNDFAYIPASDYNFWDAVRGDSPPEYGEKNNNFLIYRNRNRKNAFSQVRLLGPSAAFNLGQHAFALTTGFRYMVTGDNVPWEIPVLGYEGLNYQPLQNVNFDDYNFDFNTQGWMEIGLSYAYDIYQFIDEKITLGVTVKGAWGYAGAYAQINNANYIVLNDSTLNIKNLDGLMGYAVPVDYETNDAPMNDPFFKGWGLGADIGVTYTKQRYVGTKRFNEPCDQRYEDYIYRVGISILDIGGIKYKNNAQLHDFDNVSAYWQNFDTISYDNVNQVVQELSDVFYGSPTASYAGDQFSIGLPMAVSVQFDYHAKRYDDIYLGVYWIQPVRFNMHTLRRPAELAVIPRYETKNLEVSVPISLYEYQYPRVGLSARFYFLTVGTEQIGTYLGLGDLNGADFYFSVKFNFGKGTCKIKAPIECLNEEYGYSEKDKRNFKKRRK